MENFVHNFIGDVAVLKVDIAAATLRDVQSLWDKMEADSLFDKKKLIFDLSFCQFIDSTFIGMIIKIFKKVSENSGQMKLVIPQITNLESYRLIGITRILDCFNSLQNAIDSFNPNSSVNKIVIDQKSLYYSITD